MEMIIGAAARVLVICLLTTSALEKLRSGAGIRSVLRTLGARPVMLWWLALCFGELLGSSFMIASIPRWLSSATVLGIGVVFALAGAHAVRIRANVECACFGQLGTRRQLGWRQIRALPLWLVLAAGVYLWEPVTISQRIVLIYFSIVAILVLYMYLLVRAIVRARADRMALVAPRAVDASSSSLLRFSVPPTDIRALGRAAKEVV